MSPRFERYAARARFLRSSRKYRSNRSAEGIVEHIFPRQNRRASEEFRWFYEARRSLLIWGWRQRSWRGAPVLTGVDLLNRSLTGHYLHEALGMVALTSKGLA